MTTKVAQVSQLIIDSVNSEYTNNLDGLTADRTKKLLNELGKISTSYLEVGVLNGATFKSVIEKLENIKLIFI